MPIQREYMLAQYHGLNRVTVDELQRCLVDTGFSVHKLELITHQVRLPKGLDRRYSFADLGIAGLKLLARG